MASQRPALLHVDDNQAFRDLFPILYGRWFQVTGAPHAEAAREALGAGRFDAVVTDYDMPGMNGLDLLRLLRREHPGLPVFLYTGQGSEEVAREAFQEGASDYFVKSVSTVGHTDTVARAILKGLQARRMEERLRQHRDQVELLVEERSRELVALNQALQREIEERRALEAELRRQRALADSIFENNPYSVNVFNRQGHSVRTNPAHLRLFGTTPPPDMDVVSTIVQAYPEYGPLLARVVQGETVRLPTILYNPSHFREDLPDLDVYVTAVGFPLHDEHGQCNEIVIMHEDVTARHLAEQALQRACLELRRARGEDDSALALLDEVDRRKKVEQELLHARGSYKTLFEASNDALFVYRVQDGRLVECNRKAVEMFGLAPGEARDFSLAGALLGDPDRPGESYEREAARAAPGEAHVSEWRAVARSGRLFWVEVTVRRVAMAGEDCVLTVVRDVDQRKRMEVELQDKNRELSDAFYVVSHDLKNPLYALQLHTEALRRQPDQVGAACGCIGTILTEMTTFIDDLLSLSSAGKVIDEARRQAIGTETFLRAVLGTVNRDLTPVDLVFRGSLPALEGDPVKLEEVFRNLFSNALQNRRESADGLTLTVSYAGAPPAGEFCLADDGRGIAPEHLKRIFDPGFTGRRSGTGFGLAIVRKIVEAHGGSIRVESDGPGRGARFYLRLPTASGTPSRTCPARTGARRN